MEKGDASNKADALSNALHVGFRTGSDSARPGRDINDQAGYSGKDEDALCSSLHVGFKKGSESGWANTLPGRNAGVGTVATEPPSSSRSAEQTQALQPLDPRPAPSRQEEEARNYPSQHSRIPNASDGPTQPRKQYEVSSEPRYNTAPAQTIETDEVSSLEDRTPFDEDEVSFQGRLRRKKLRREIYFRSESIEDPEGATTGRPGDESAPGEGENPTGCEHYVKDYDADEARNTIVEVRTPRGIYRGESPPTDGRVYFGTLFFSDGVIYKGDWKGDVEEGFGTMTYSKGDIYLGYWKGGVREGAGAILFENGDFYTGEFEGNEENGYGEMTYSNGERYGGDWRNGKREGSGVLYSPITGSIHSAQWTSGHENLDRPIDVINVSSSDLSLVAIVSLYLGSICALLSYAMKFASKKTN